MSRAPKEFLTDQVKRWRHPDNGAVLFVTELFGVVPDGWQLEALIAVSNPNTRRLAMKACKGPGKTAVLAWIILWFLTCHYESKVGCTSITEGNIDTNLWPELLKWMNRSGFLKAAFTWSRTQVVRNGNANWFAVKRTWPKTGNAEAQSDALAGVHADDVMFILDESGGIPQAVMVTAEAVLSTEIKAGHRGLVIQAGNPTHTTGPLYRACTTDKALWYVITITGDPDRKDRSTRISLEWAREQIASYGRDNPWVMVNVLGEFPPSSINSLLGVEEVEAAMRRHLPASTYNWAQKRLGVDVARFGDDRTVIFPRQGLAAFKPLIMRNARTTDIAARVAKAENDWSRGGDQVLTFIDDTGHWGHGVIDNLIASGRSPIPLVYHSKALSPRYKNRRCEFWLEGAKWVKGGGALPNIPELVAELTEPTYTFVGGVFLLEDKDQIKERIGRSPDLADGLFQTFAIPDMPGALIGGMGQGKALRDGDPYATNDTTQQEGGRSIRDFDPLEG